ncbi:MAG: protein kinase [Marmoricola sp.]
MSGFPMPGHRVGPYRVVREIGRGPRGVVLEALDTRPDPQVGPPRVAIAVRTPETLLREDLVARYGADLDRLAATRSSRLLPVLSVGAHDDRLLAVSPYAAGGSVADRLAAGPLDPAVVLPWATALADGLAAVHEAGLVHGHVCATNLLLPGDDGLPLLADVGGAQLAQDWLRPPGVAEEPQDPESPSAARDVRDAGRLVLALAHGAPGPALAEVVDRALDPEPARRYADGAALARALRLVPREDRAVPALDRAARRRVLAVVAASAAAVLAVGAAVVALSARHDGAEPAAAQRAALPTGAPTTDAPVARSVTAAPARPRLRGAPAYRSVVFTLEAPATGGLQVDRGEGWTDVATRTVTVPTRAGGDRACLRARTVLDGRTSAPARACAASAPPELTTVRQPDCLIDGAYRQVCYSLVARGFAPGTDEQLAFSVAGRPEGTVTIHLGRDGSGTLPAGQHFHFADGDAGATARIEMAGLSHTWQVAARG